MSDLGPILLVLAAQITLPVLAGLLFSRRRDPAAACVPPAVASVAVLLLTPLAFVPRPHWPAGKPVIAEHHEEVAVESPPQFAAAPGGIDLLQLLRLPKPQVAAEKSSRFDLWRLIAIAFVGLSCLGLLRFLFSLIATIRVARGSRPLHDVELQALADLVAHEARG